MIHLFCHVVCIDTGVYTTKYGAIVSANGETIDDGEGCVAK
jgi:hypothetical protein